MRLMIKNAQESSALDSKGHNTLDVSLQWLQENAGKVFKTVHETPKELVTYLTYPEYQLMYDTEPERLDDLKIKITYHFINFEGKQYRINQAYTIVIP